MSSSVRGVPLCAECEEVGMARGEGVWSQIVGVQKLNQKRNTKSIGNRNLCPLSTLRNSEVIYCNT